MALIGETGIKPVDPASIPQRRLYTGATMPAVGLGTFGSDAVGPADAPPYYELPPDWVCEILSPSTAAIDRAEKLPIYATESVAHVWLVDPILRMLEVHRLDGETYRTVAMWRDSAVVRAEPFDALELELAALWET